MKMETLVKAKKWGSSLAFIVPSKVADELGMKAGGEFAVDVRPTGKSNVLRELWGKGKGKGERKTAQEWKDEFRRTLYRE